MAHHRDLAMPLGRAFQNGANALFHLRYCPLFSYGFAEKVT